MTRIALVLGLFTLIGCTSSAYHNSQSVWDATVEITNLQGNSGGTGSVLSSSSIESIVLTNAHVCDIATQGGAVVRNAKGVNTPVVSFKVYKKHDLCLITVFEDLHAELHLAEDAPKPGDIIMSSGHPRLLPTNQQVGRVGGKHIIAVQTHKLRACTDQERNSPETGFYCMLAGGLPQIVIYETLSLGILISPGSSGSPVVDANGDLVAVIFAGAGDPGWAEAVPYEFVKDFLENESKTDSIEFPNMSI